MLKSSLCGAVFLLAASLSTAARADFSCTVSVSGVLTYSEGTVNVLHAGRGDWTHICNLNEPRTVGNLTVQPTTCAMWAAQLLRARKDGQAIEFYYPGTGTCAKMPTYSSSPVPVYIGG